MHYPEELAHWKPTCAARIDLLVTVEMSQS